MRLSEVIIDFIHKLGPKFCSSVNLFYANTRDSECFQRVTGVHNLVQLITPVEH